MMRYVSMLRMLGERDVIYCLGLLDFLSPSMLDYYLTCCIKSANTIGKPCFILQTVAQTQTIVDYSIN